MQIQNNYNTNFKGGFRFPQVSTETRTAINSFCQKGRGKQLFDNFEREGDMFLVVRDELDRKVAQIITDSNANFQYYPYINTKSGLDNEIPERLSTLCEKYKPQTGDIKTLIRLYSRDRKLQTAYCEHISSMDNILKSVDVKLNNPKKTMQLGALTLKDDNFAVTMSPLNKAGVRYIMVEKVKSTSTYEPTKYYAVREDGLCLKQFKPAEISDFKEKFKSTLLK